VAELLTVLHVLAAIFLVGPMAMLPMTAMRAVRTGSGPTVRLLTRSTRVFSLASLAVAVLGFGILGIEGKERGWSVGTGWVLGSIVCYLLALAINLAVVVPALGRAADDVINRGPGRGPLYGRIAAGSGIATLLLVLVTVLMVWRP
jgi:uncharacterized membrane protein